MFVHARTRARLSVHQGNNRRNCKLLEKYFSDIILLFRLQIIMLHWRMWIMQVLSPEVGWLLRVRVA